MKAGRWPRRCSSCAARWDLDPPDTAPQWRGPGARAGLHPRRGQAAAALLPQIRKAQDALDGIIRDLEAGADMLRRDNLTLADDQQRCATILVQLQRQVDLGRMIDRRLAKQAAAPGLEATRRAFVEEELLFPLRQRIVDLQQQVAVSQQGVLALEVVIRNNRELVRGVDRAINVTVSALNVAVTVALGLANQRLVLDRVAALNEATSSMIAGTARRCCTRASKSDPRRFRRPRHGRPRKSLRRRHRRHRRPVELPPGRPPKLDAQIDRLATLAKRGEQAIGCSTRGNRAEAHGSLRDGGGKNPWAGTHPGMLPAFVSRRRLRVVSRQPANAPRPSPRAA